MAANTFKAPVSPLEPEVRKTGPNLFSWLEGGLRFDSLFSDGIPAWMLPRIAFGFFLCLLYIGISHQSNRTIQKLNKAKVLLEDLRVNYTTQKAELMYQSKQSEVAKSVRELGLKESAVPPQKVPVQE
jgi:hypothetical protein